MMKLMKECWVTKFERETERLRLRPIELTDADKIGELHRDPGILRWYGPWSHDQVYDWTAAQAHGWHHDGVGKWMAYDKKSGELVGRGGLSIADVDGERRLEVGWAVCESLWGRGFATEIGDAGIEFARTELKAEDVVAFTEVHNWASRAVMEKLHMKLVRNFLSAGIPEGGTEVRENVPFVLYTTVNLN
jgi:RimJ/RimL family protein N-acetyltransferase